MFNRKSSTNTLTFTANLTDPEMKKTTEHLFEIKYNVFSFAFDSQASLEKFVRETVVSVFQDCRNNHSLVRENEFAKRLNPKGVSYQDGGATPTSAIKNVGPLSL